MKTTLPIKKIELFNSFRVHKHNLVKRLFIRLLRVRNIPVYRYKFKVTFISEHSLIINSIITLGVRGGTFTVISVTDNSVIVIANQVMTSYSAGIILYNDQCIIVYHPMNSIDRNFVRLKY